jgi:uncharacterized protein (TIGR03435 family)
MFMTTMPVRSICATLVLAVSSAFAQAPAAKPKLAFEVASIKPAGPLDPAAIMSGKAHIGMKVDGFRVDIGMFAISDLIRTAYKLKTYELTSPEWMNGMSAQRWDIIATMPKGATKDDVPQMLQTLLAERFKLEFHKESKEHNAYVLTVAKSGLKMQEAPPDPDPAKAEPLAPGESPKPPSGNDNMKIDVKQTSDGANISMGNSETGPMKMNMTKDGMHMEAEKMPMDGLLEFMAKLANKPIVDQTGLKGKYKVALDVPMTELMNMARAMGAPVPGNAPGAGPADAASDPTGASTIFQTVKTLGLNLEAKKMPIEILVVDKCEKAPTEN